MRRLILVAVLCATLVVLIAPASISAASDPLDGLTDVEKAYVNRMKGAYGAANGALDKLSGELGSAAFGAFLGGGMPEPQELASMVLSCRSELVAVVPLFREAPPASMQDLADAHSAIAARLEGAFSPVLGILYEEGQEQVLHAGRHWLSGLLGADPPPDKPRASLKARLASSVLGEIGDLRSLLNAGQGALDAVIKNVQEQQAAGEDFLNFLFDECFIATAAYGSNTAAEIDVLRDFRDGVLLRSPEGRDLVGFYYAASPPLAEFIRGHELVRTVVREGIIDPIVWAMSRLRPLWSVAP